MANQNLVQKLVDQNKKVLVKMTGTFDGASGQETSVIKVDVSSLAFALNTSGKIMTANTNPKSTYRVYPTKIIYSVGINSGYVRLHYDDAGDGTLGVLRSSGDIDTEALSLSNPQATSNGDICLSTMGAVANDSYTVIMDMRKEATDYDQGQTAEPQPFNLRF